MSHGRSPTQCASRPSGARCVRHRRAEPESEFPGPTTSDFGIPGPVQQVSTYDLFTVWHHLAMGRMTPPTQNDRNAAHSGPVFLPWHRLMLLLFELQIQRILNDATRLGPN